MPNTVCDREQRTSDLSSDFRGVGKKTSAAAGA